MDASIGKPGQSEIVTERGAAGRNSLNESWLNSVSPPAVKSDPVISDSGSPPFSQDRSGGLGSYEQSSSPIERKSFESLTVSQRAGVTFETLNLETKDFREFINCIVATLETSDLQEEIFERTLAWLVAEAESGIKFNDEKISIDVAKMKQDWADNASLFAIANDLKFAVAEAIEAKKWDPVSNRGEICACEYVAMLFATSYGYRGRLLGDSCTDSEFLYVVQNSPLAGLIS